MSRAGISRIQGCEIRLGWVGSRKIQYLTAWGSLCLTFQSGCDSVKIQGGSLNSRSKIIGNNPTHGLTPATSKYKCVLQMHTSQNPGFPTAMNLILVKVDIKTSKQRRVFGGYGKQGWDFGRFRWLFGTQTQKRPKGHPSFG